MPSPRKRPRKGNAEDERAVPDSAVGDGKAEITTVNGATADRPPTDPGSLIRLPLDHAAGKMDSDRLQFPDSDVLRSLQQRYLSAQPFPHLVLRRLFPDGFLRRARDEIIQHCEATHKETDIYRVYQTGDLANLDGLQPDEARRLGTLARLRRYLYSAEIRDWMERLTGCCDVEAGEHLDGDTIDCSVNAYTRGCHLLCHDDVIGTRRLSYILYLTDPDEPWRAEDGGALQLYGTAAGDGQPEPYPCQSLCPEWNGMVVFRVLPGRSFHSVQEVLQEERPRLSISGWYHVVSAKTRADAASSSLASLEGHGRLAPLDAPFVPLERPLSDAASSALTAVERDQLLQYLNPEYLRPAVLQALRRRFAEECSVQLHDFLNPARVAWPLLEQLIDADRRQATEPSATASATGAWHTVGPPHMRRYLQLNAAAVGGSPSAAPREHTLAALRAWMGSPALMHYIERMTGVDVTHGGLVAGRGVVRRFRPGLDYTLATRHGMVSDGEPSVVDVTLCLVDDRGDEQHAAWQSQELGGYECYMDAGGGDGGDPAVYRSGTQTPAERKVSADEDDESDDNEAGDGTLLVVAPAHNTLSIVLRDEQVMRFIKYVSAAAPGSRWDIAMEYQTSGHDSKRQRWRTLFRDET